MRKVTERKAEAALQEIYFNGRLALLAKIHAAFALGRICNIEDPGAVNNEAARVAYELIDSIKEQQK